MPSIWERRCNSGKNDVPFVRGWNEQDDGVEG